MASKEFSSTQPLFGCPSPVGTGTAPVLVAEGLIEESVCLGSALHDSTATGCWCGWGAQICRALTVICGCGWWRWYGRRPLLGVLACLSSGTQCSQAVSLLTAELGLFAWFLSSPVHTDQLGQPGFVQLAGTWAAR